jgi:hypothetical protein
MSCSRNRSALLVAMALITTTLAPVYARAPRPTDYHVTTTIADVGGTHPLLVQSDRKGAYVTKTVNRVVQVSSMINQFSTGSSWSLTTYAMAKGGYLASDRTVFFDAREQVATGAFPTPLIGTDGSGALVEYGQATAHLIAKCQVVNVDMLRIPVGTSVACPGSMRFRALDGQWYRFSFAPDNFSTSELFNVTCTAADSTGCKVWSITPSGSALTGDDPNPKSRHTLLAINENGEILSQGGDYHLSFSITVAR